MKYGKRIRNVFFAHNGFRFDYRFLYEELYARLGFFNIVGDIGSTKSIKGKGLTFYDTALFFPFKLEILAK